MSEMLDLEIDTESLEEFGAKSLTCKNEQIAQLCWNGDVDESKRRSGLIAEINGLDKNRIGFKKYWDENEVPILNEKSKYSKDEIDSVSRTGNKVGATSNNSVFTRYLLCSNFPSDTKVLDFGAGKDSRQAQKISTKYSNVVAHDFHEVISDSGVDSLFDINALDKDNGYDVVIASNVLNVQPSCEMLEKTLDDLYCVMGEGKKLVVNVPRAPIKVNCSGELKTHAELVEIVRESMENRFGEGSVKEVSKVCGKNTSTTLFEVVKTDSKNEDIFCSI
jgi:hypothetical protein